MTDTLIIRQLHKQPYAQTWAAMRAFTDTRDEHTTDEIWLLEHEPVFTQGQNGKPEHVLNPENIPVIATDRGGQVTYHGPGQLMIYTLINLNRKKWNVREFVSKLEQTIIDFLNHYDIKAVSKKEAPGVYVEERKIASIGLRVRRGFTYHGVAFNVHMDLSPFSRINPCGFSNLQMTQLHDEGVSHTLTVCANQIVDYFKSNLGYTTLHYEPSQTLDCLKP